LQVKAQAALILAIVEREIGDLETVALEDEKNDERDGYKAEASADQPITVMSHKVAAVVTPVTSRSRLTTAPAPMNPLVQFWVGSRRDDAT
jgi:hypothetical protein